MFIMKGEDLRQIINDQEKISQAKIARYLNMTPQAFNSKLRAKKLSKEFINNVTSIINGGASSPEQLQENQTNNDLLARDLDILLRLSKMQEKLITNLDSKVEQLESRIKSIENALSQKKIYEPTKKM